MRTRMRALKTQEGLGPNVERRQQKRSWEHMTLTPVGNLGAVIQDMSGSFVDNKGQKMSMA
jgi:hypothetical protein